MRNLGLPIDAMIEHHEEAIKTENYTCIIRADISVQKTTKLGMEMPVATPFTRTKVV